MKKHFTLIELLVVIAIILDSRQRITRSVIAAA